MSYLLSNSFSLSLSFHFFFSSPSEESLLTHSFFFLLHKSPHLQPTNNSPTNSPLPSRRESHGESRRVCVSAALAPFSSGKWSADWWRKQWHDQYDENETDFHYLFLLSLFLSLQGYKSKLQVGREVKTDDSFVEIFVLRRG